MGSYNLMFSLERDVFWLSRKNAEAVYDAFVPQLSECIAGEFEDVKEVEMMNKYISFVDLSEDDFNQAYELVMNAENLNPELKDQIKQAFEADPRFKSVEVA